MGIPAAGVVVLKALRIVAIVYVVFTVVAWSISDSIMFQPPSPPDYQITDALVRLPVGDDGDTIVAVFNRVPGPRATVLLAHGNGRDLGDLAGAIDPLNEAGFDVMSFDYRGYGHSTGESSEDNTYADIDAVYRHLVGDEHVAPEDIVVVGHSLGGGPAAWLAQHRPVRALLLASTFTSAFNVVLPAWILPFDAYETEERLPDVHVPVVVAHGTADEIVDVENARPLFESANEPKRLEIVPGAGHDGVFTDPDSGLDDLLDWLLEQER